MPRYPFPDVPQLPGVPQVNRSNAFPAGPGPQVAGVLALGRLTLSLLSPPSWGIYEDTTDTDAEELRAENAKRAADDQLTDIVTAAPTPVLVPDSFRELNYRNEFILTDAPTEAGGFATYNKVATPFEITLRLTKGGTLAERTKFLDAAESISKSLKLYKIVTPERTYLRCNVMSFELRRKEAKGAFFFGECDLSFREIRAVTTFSTADGVITEKAKQPSAFPTKTRGTVRALDDVSGAVGRVLDRAGGLL
jgi:hypothetical protein